MVLLADRGFCSFALWRKASDTGADLLWRVRIDPVGPKPQHVRGLPDGSWLAHLRRSTDRTSEPMLARVIDYTIDDGRGNTTEYRLLPPCWTRRPPADAVAAGYAQRWEIGKHVRRAQDPSARTEDGSPLQVPGPGPPEIWGHLCCHFAIRSLMTEATRHAGHDPDRVNFTAALRITRRTIAHAGD